MKVSMLIWATRVQTDKQFHLKAPIAHKTGRTILPYCVVIAHKLQKHIFNEIVFQEKHGAEKKNSFPVVATWDREQHCTLWSSPRSTFHQADSPPATLQGPANEVPYTKKIYSSSCKSEILIQIWPTLGFVQVSWCIQRNATCLNKLSRQCVKNILLIHWVWALTIS